MKPSGRKTPLWETLIIIASFGGMWVYFGFWLMARRAQEPLSPAWQLLLLPCLVALYFVFRRRLQRAADVLREEREQKQSGFPFAPPPRPHDDHQHHNGQ